MHLNCVLLYFVFLLLFSSYNVKRFVVIFNFIQSCQSYHNVLTFAFIECILDFVML